MGCLNGKQGLEIPLEARIVAVADIYDALMSDRPYRKDVNYSKAIGLLLSMRGTFLEPVIIDCFTTAIKNNRRLADEVSHV